MADLADDPHRSTPERLMTNGHRLGLMRAILRFDEIGILLAVIVFFVIGTASSPYFLTVNNVTGILQNITFLGFLGMANDRLVRKQFGDLGILHEMDIEPIENSRQGACDQRLQFAQRLSRGAVDADKIKTRLD
jgi:hypothetical protein